MFVCDRTTEPVAPGEPNGTRAGYSQGLAVKTGLQLPSTSTSWNMVNQFGKNYLLTLPQRTAAGAAVHYTTKLHVYTTKLQCCVNFVFVSSFFVCLFRFILFFTGIVSKVDHNYNNYASYSLHIHSAH